jgi:hypothetical protein
VNASEHTPSEPGHVAPVIAAEGCASPARISQELAERMYEALTEIAFSPESSEWAKKRAAQAFWVITDPPPQEAINLGRELAKRYG